jgi:hypothetical protein
MPAIDFPNSPSVNDQFTAAGKTWVWTGTSWDAVEVSGGSVTSIATNAPITGGPITSTGTISITQANTSTNGYLSSTDWNTFNSKEPALTKGNLTESTSSVLTITGGTGAVIGSGTTIQVKQATSTQSGFLSATDWNTFSFDDIVVDLGNVSGAVVINLSLGAKFKMNQTGNITSFSFINEVLGRDYLFEITRQTTNYTFTFAAGKFRFPIGATPIMTNPTTNGTSPAKAVDILTGLCMVSGRLDIVITPDLLEN